MSVWNRALMTVRVSAYVFLVQVGAELNKLQSSVDDTKPEDADKCKSMST